MSQNTVSIQLNQEESVELKSVLESKGWKEDILPNNPYMKIRMISPLGSFATLYTSSKLLLQGREDFSGIISDIKRGCQPFSLEIDPHIGVDEVGKGDYFGPLVVVACFVSSEIVEKLSCLGVGDSKKFSDARILSMYKELKDYSYYYSSIVSPKDYNNIYKKIGNVSILLAKEHSRVIEMGLLDLQERGVKCDYVVIDQFSSSKGRVRNELGALGSKVDFRQFHKGESDIAVATASIIARGIFLEEMEQMGEQYYFKFPKGASNVIESARRFVAEKGEKELYNVAKVSFKTTSRVTNRFVY